MLRLVERLLDAFHEDRISYCHWKSNAAIERALSGEGDLDVLVSQADTARVYRTLFRLDFKRLTEPAGREYPGIEHWLGYSEGEGVFSHLHLHFRLVYGEQFIKGLRFRDEEGILRRRVFARGIFQISPADEMVFLFIRSIVKADFIGVLKKSLGVADRYFPQHILLEYDYLGQKIRPGELEEACDVFAPGIKIDAMVDAIVNIVNLNLIDIWGWRRKFREELRFSRRFSRTEYGAKCIEVCCRRLVLKLHLAKKAKKRVYSGGKTVALLGADGAGKSAMVMELEKWLGRYLDVETVYCGTGDGEKGVALGILDSVLTAGVDGMGRHRAGSIPMNDSKAWRSALVALVGNIRAVLIALHRRSTVLRAQRYCNMGKIVIYDRFPQPFQRNYCDGPKIVRRGGALTSRLYRWEERIYEQLFSQYPDHCVVLMVDPDVSVARKRDNQKAMIVAKNEVLERILERKPENTIMIDANCDYGAVLSRLKREVWAWL